MPFQFPIPTLPTLAPSPRWHRLHEWAARVSAELATLSDDEQREARHLARTTVLSIEQAIAVVRDRRPRP